MTVSVCNNVSFFVWQGQLSNRLRSSSMTDGVSDQAPAPPLMVHKSHPWQIPPSWSVASLISPLVLLLLAYRTSFFVLWAPKTRTCLIYPLCAGMFQHRQITFCSSLHVGFALICIRQVLLPPPLPSCFLRFVDFTVLSSHTFSFCSSSSFPSISLCPLWFTHTYVGIGK